MAKHSYHLEIEEYAGGGVWTRLFSTDDSLAFNLGRVAERRASPGPRLAMRCVRDDGQVMDEATAKTDDRVAALRRRVAELERFVALLVKQLPDVKRRVHKDGSWCLENDDRCRRAHLMELWATDSSTDNDCGGGS